MFLWLPGGTVDITVHETQADGTIRELYKANGGPWGGTKIDEAFQTFLEDVAGVDTMEIFMKYVCYCLLFKILYVFL
jgi:hypothetical protein